jgi:pyridoxal phosphate enzyme (YggS family)
MTTLRDNLAAVRGRIESACRRARRDASEVTIIAVTKGHPATAIVDAVEVGLLDVGENRVQEALLKIPQAPPAARVHLIGHLQSNKVNKAVGVFSSIASVDRLDLLERIARRAAASGIVQPVWLQVNITGEPQKGGCSASQARELWERALETSSVEARGFMGIARMQAPEVEVRRDFAKLRELGASLRCADGSSPRLSMGMSDDFEWAILEGATHLRLGTVLLGSRT